MVEEMGHKLTAPPDFDGPASSYDRRVTDVLCTVLLWAMWISMTVLGVYAMRNGDYRVLLHPLDYAGNREYIVWSSDSLSPYFEIFSRFSQSLDSISTYVFDKYDNQ